MLAYLKPQKFPFLAEKLGKLGVVKQAETVTVVTVEKAYFPEFYFTIRLSAGGQSGTSAVPRPGRPAEPVCLKLPRWAEAVELEAVDKRGRTAAKGSVTLHTLLRGTAVSLELRAVSDDYLEAGARFTVQLRARVVATERTPLVLQLGRGELGSARLQAAVAQASLETGSETGALASALHGPLRSRGTRAQYGCVEVRRGEYDELDPRAASAPAPRRVLCLYEEPAPSQGADPLFSLPVASIAHVSVTSPDSFQVKVRSAAGDLRALDFHGADCEVWAGGLRALAQRTLMEEARAEMAAKQRPRA